MSEEQGERDRGRQIDSGRVRERNRDGEREGERERERFRETAIERESDRDRYRVRENTSNALSLLSLRLNDVL